MSINFYCSRRQAYCYFENLKNGKKIRFYGGREMEIEPDSYFFQFDDEFGFDYLSFSEIGDWINFWNRSEALMSFYGRGSVAVELVEGIEEEGEFECFEGCDVMFREVCGIYLVNPRYSGMIIETFDGITDDYFLAVCDTARYFGDFRTLRGKKGLADYHDYKCLNVIYEFLGREKGEFLIREGPVYERWKRLAGGGGGRDEN